VTPHVTNSSAIHGLRVLHLEDDPHDRELAAAALENDGLHCDYQYAVSREQFEAALLSQQFDLILADYQLPSFDGLTAQGLARRLSPQTPFVLLSGTLGEELAVERIKDGATDYVVKQSMSRLPSAVRRALRESAERAERQRAEDEVRRLNAELERRVAERTTELATANRALAEREAALQKSTRWLDAILDHSPVAIYVKGIDGRFVLANRKTETMLQRPPAEIVGRTASELIAPRLAEIYEANDRRVVAERRDLRFEEPAVHPKGISVWASTKFPLYDESGALYALCGISEDITERKTHEDELRLARLEAQRANLAKSEFLSRMSHDLRTPLNAILGFAQILELGTLDASQRDSIRQILHGGRHLLELINEVLDISRIESGQLSLSIEPVSLHDLVREAVELINPLAAHRGIAVRVDLCAMGHGYVLADRQRVMQILLNLLSNAVKYNRADGSIQVRCEGRPDGLHRLSVADTGFGIPAEKLKLLFQPFERLGAERSGIEGTGLGLSLARALAETMNGALGVDTAIDRGSTFWIELPDAAAPALDEAPASRAAATAPSPGCGTVLYVEDNASNLRLMQRVLERRPGVTLLHASDGARGVQLAREEQPSLVLLDMHLPDMTGEEVLRSLWSGPSTRSIPVVVLTADATPGLVRRLKAAGALECFTKPMDVPRVLALIDRALDTTAGRDAH
jgi:PAS domain S-box-containing protein